MLRRIDERIFMVAVLVLGFGLRVFRIGAQSFWVDEIITLRKGVLPREGLGIWDYMKYNLQGPLHSLVGYWFHFVSMDEGWLRLPSALAGTASLYFFYKWIKVWMGERIARVATVLLLINPLHIYYSQELRAYAFLFLFVTIAAWAFHLWLRSEKEWRPVVYAVSLAAAALSSLTAAFLYVTHTILRLWQSRTRRSVAGWVLVSVLIAVLISPWIYRLAVVINVPELVTPVMPGEIEVSDRLRGATTTGLATIPFTAYAFSVGFSLGPSLRELHEHHAVADVLRAHGPAVIWVALLFGILAVRGFIALVRDGRTWGSLLLYLLTPLILMLALTWQNAKTFNVRYVLVSLPAYLCLLAAGLASLEGWWRRLAAPAVAATLLFSLGNYYFNGRYAREDVRGAADLVSRASAAGECVIAPTVQRVFEYYYAGEASVDTVYAPAWLPHPPIEDQLEELVTHCDAVWYVRARAWEFDDEATLRENLGTVYTPGATFLFDGVEVTRYGERAP